MRVDGADEQAAFIEKRRRLFKKLDGPAEAYQESSATGETAASGMEQMDATEWERLFIRRARIKRNVVTTVAVLIFLAMLIVPPLIVSPIVAYMPPRWHECHLQC